MAYSSPDAVYAYNYSLDKVQCVSLHRKLPESNQLREQYKDLLTIKYPILPGLRRISFKRERSRQIETECVLYCHFLVILKVRDDDNHVKLWPRSII